MDGAQTKYQEFVLFSPVAVQRHDQILNILAGVTAMQPRPICEQHLVYAQLRQASETTTTKKTISGKSAAQASVTKQLTHRHLIRHLSFTCDSQDGAGSWMLRVEGLPEAGSKAVISRAIVDSVTTDAELEKFRGGSQDNQYEPA